MTGLKRTLSEKRRMVVPLAAGLALNLLLYIGAVYPLGVRARTAERRAAASAADLAAAERDDRSVQALIEGRTETDAALDRFYAHVLPADMSTARGITYLHLAQLADDHNLRSLRRSAAPDPDQKGTLERMRITMALEGDYEDLRRFIYDLESGADFIVIDGVVITQGADPDLRCSSRSTCPRTTSMARKRQREVVLALVAAAAVVAAVYSVRSFSPASGSGSPSAAASAAEGRGGSPHGVSGVNLQALDQQRPAPGNSSRDPFRFKPKPAPPPAASRAPAAAPAPAAPAVPALPPIALKFIGVVESPGTGRIAVLSDGRGVYEGREGGTIEGRYRILKIGVESVDLAYLDGRGRQTIRLTGQ